MKKYKLHLLIILAIIAAVGLNQCTKSTDSSGIIKGPYVQNVKTDGITIMWESKKATTGTVLFGKNRSLKNKIAENDTTRFHEIQLSGLKIETLFYYQVVSGESKSDVITFKTAVRKDSPFRFAVYGDNKSGPFNHEKNANLIASKKPDFVLHNGDLVNRGYVYKQWELLFFNPTRKLLPSIPMYPVLGNHERHADYYFKYFSLPNNEVFYSFDYGNAHFIMLDPADDDFLTANKDAGQLKWLINDLEENKAEWTIVNFHYPPFTAGGNYYKNYRIKLKNLIHPIFEKYGVDIVFSGHDHDYERTYPIVSKNGKHPVTYVVAGNGGTSMRYVGKREWTLYSERVFGFVLININGSKLHFQSININDEVIDEFVLDKNDPHSVADYESHKIYFEDINDPVLAVKYYNEGDDFLDEEKFNEAMVKFQKAFQSDTTCVEALGGIAECYYELGDFENAIEFANKAVAKMDNFPDGYEVLIDVYMDQEKWELALDWADKLFIITSDSPDANEVKAEIYAKQNMWDQAVEEMKKAITLQPSESDLFFGLGEIYEQAGDQQKAVLSYKKGLEWFMDEKEDEYVKEIRKKIEKLNQ
jgi:tetratricopeptide (TPR) repeat protein